MDWSSLFTMVAIGLMFFMMMRHGGGCCGGTGPRGGHRGRDEAGRKDGPRKDGGTDERE